MEAIVSSYTIKNMRPIMKRYGIHWGTSKMKKADIVRHICSTIKLNIRFKNDICGILNDFSIPNELLNKYIVFYKLKSNMALEINSRLYLKKRNSKIKYSVFNAILEIIKNKKSREIIKEKCEELNILEKFNVLDIVDKEIKQWGNDITFELSPHVKKLEQHNQHYKIEKQFGGFDDSHEKILYHGCDETTKDSILYDGNFSLLMCGRKHGSKFGPGIYLTDKLWKAVQYSETQKKMKHYKYVLLCKVLVKNIKPASSYEVTFSRKSKNDEKEEIYDTGVDNISDPIEYIKKDSNHICVIGYMKICIEKRNCKLLNTSYNSIGTLSMVGIRFINKYGHYGDYVTIFWINPSGSQILMNNKLMFNDVTLIKTTINHKFKIYSHRNNQLIMTKVINQTDIVNNYVIIA